MSRVYTNQFLSTFIPTVTLWLFGYSTLFITPNEEGFNNRYMGSGTALLVMATLINVVKGDLPKTAYMKFIDVWFLWHVVTVFMIITYHIVLVRIRKMLENHDSTVGINASLDRVNVNGLDEENNNTIENINKALIFLFPVINIVFYIVYFYLTVQ